MELGKGRWHECACLQVQRCRGGDRPRFLRASDWDQMDTRLHRRNSQVGHKLGSKSHLRLLTWSVKVFSHGFSPLLLSPQIRPLPWYCPMVIQDCLPPSPRNALYVLLQPIHSALQFLVSKNIIHRQVECILVGPHVILPLQCPISTEIFWR